MIVGGVAIGHGDTAQATQAARSQTCEATMSAPGGGDHDGRGKGDGGHWTIVLRTTLPYDREVAVTCVCGRRAGRGGELSQPAALQPEPDVSVIRRPSVRSAARINPGSGCVVAASVRHGGG